MGWRAARLPEIGPMGGKRAVSEKLVLVEQDREITTVMLDQAEGV